MRTIKFRGLTLNGEWHFGNLAILKQKVNVSDAGSYISNKVGLPFAYAVRPETVGQFTGLTDKNGVEIYEGDIVAFGKDVVEVLYQTRSASFVFGKRGWLNNHFIEEMNDIFEAEVIGNVFSNPELLKEGAE